jgi:hypothetical protein
MFCPDCKYESKPGVYNCPDCGVDLVFALSPEQLKHPKEPQVELVIVFQSRIFPNIAIAKSILEDAGIEYIAMGGRGGSGGVLQVTSDKADEARTLLEVIE